MTELQIGTFARSNEQIDSAIENNADFVDLRMDLHHSIDFEAARNTLRQAGIPITLHLPSSPDWKPIDVSQEILPYIDLGRQIDAELVTMHTTLSSLFYSDDDIDSFLQGIRPACEAAQAAGVQLAIENLGLLYTEMALLFDQEPYIKMALDIGHGQIMAIRNRALDHIESFYDRIMMVNVHDNHGRDMIEEVVGMRKKGRLSRKEIRELAKKYDEHLCIGEGIIDFETIFRQLKERGYDGKFLMMCADPLRFPEERAKFLDIWNSL